jgi:ATP-binding cassette subfamily C (CFTR/MRP) protein 4
MFVPGGGQRARIGLARALYRDADLVLLDDPLSAVDSKVARLLFESAIQDMCVARGKCVVLATHQYQLIANETCILMKRGSIIEIAPYANCINQSEGLLKSTGTKSREASSSPRALMRFLT